MTFNFNSELYADSNVAEGVDYARRHRRHERFDDTLARTDDVPKTTILAPHGGGIEPGTSELCLAVAGYHPAGLPQIPLTGVTYDYWMLVGGGNTTLRGYLLEGLRTAAFDARDAGQHGELNGDAKCNIVNRTLLGM